KPVEQNTEKYAGMGIDFSNAKSFHQIMLKGCRTWMVLLGVLLSTFAGIADAQIIANVSATASSEYPNRDALHAVDGSGLSPGDNLASTPDQAHSTGADGDV